LALRGLGFVESVLRFSVVLGDAQAVLVHDAQLLLRPRVALVGGFAKPLQRLAVFLRQTPGVAALSQLGKDQGTGCKTLRFLCSSVNGKPLATTLSVVPKVGRSTVS
jgi:hypothetical protein